MREHVDGLARMRLGPSSSGARVIAEYEAEKAWVQAGGDRCRSCVECHPAAYASTVHAAQGRTVQNMHVVVDEMMDRVAFYVAMSRGKIENRAYVITKQMVPRAVDNELRTAGLAIGNGEDSTRPGCIYEALEFVRGLGEEPVD
jgi:hypothetical protein